MAKEDQSAERPPIMLSRPLKFVEPNQFTDPDAAARKLVEIAGSA